MKNPQRQANWMISPKSNAIVSDKHDGIFIGGATDSESKEYYGGILVCESIQDTVAEQIIADHEFCKSFTENDRDNFADLVWWLKGYKAGADNNFNNCPFGEDHLRSLEDLIKKMRSIL